MRRDPGALIALLLRRVRITDSMQYCFVPSGDWETDASPAPYKPKDAIGFHILAGGSCWLEIGSERTMLREGDIAAFPFGTLHRIGAGSGGSEIDPGGALPPTPWIETPVLRFGNSKRVVRMLCGYVRCEATHFRPFRRSLPEFIHVSTANDGDWLSGIIAQIVREVDVPRRGGTAMLERLTEIALLEVLRRQFLQGSAGYAGWLEAIQDPVVGRCLDLLHGEPMRPWTLNILARDVGASRSVVADRFAEKLGIAPIAYLRDWRLFLARERLVQTNVPIALLAAEAGYASEAAFNRAFGRANGLPPAAFRRQNKPS
ncbi:AraC family transcriptional regulator [Albidovulum aquaemixtae]|uniref:AraC family transcriptional regulator n=1 Tax=Albidovulum aquaemixtae TaxID=1542388 RepID=UPI002481CCB9|nr:AraC family transcriptional regulator [Defluviimonas aquaemixtae]